MRPRPLWYILDENDQPVPVEPWDSLDGEATAITVYAKWMMANNYHPDGRVKHVALTFLDDDKGFDGPYVSTVFLGTDHSFRGDGPPVLWETMVFGLGDDDDWQQRYTNKLAAIAGHDQMVALARAIIAVRAMKP